MASIITPERLLVGSTGRLEITLFFSNLPWKRLEYPYRVVESESIQRGIARVSLVHGVDSDWKELRGQLKSHPEPVINYTLYLHQLFPLPNMLMYGGWRGELSELSDTLTVAVSVPQGG